ncbi:MAG: TRAP transporter small permease [Deltaproteobacteria bacterium]|nr:TRAP transporter small permease [Deltaproteobacteria bacterium]
MQPDRSLLDRKWARVVIMAFTWLAAATLCLMVIVIVVNVVGRYLFRLPLQGTVEIAELALVVTVVFAFAYTEMENGHVTMDEVVARFPRRVRAVLIRIMYFAAAAFFFIMGWRAVVLSISHARPLMRVTDVLKIPIAPLIFIVAVGAVMFGLVLLIKGFSPLPIGEGEKDEVE